MSDTQSLIDQLWDFSNPRESESRFRHAADDQANPAARLELRTQVARSLGLQRRFDEAHRILDETERTPGVHENALMRCLLERGRLFNSSSVRDKALPLFHRAFDAATEANNSHLAIDAAHMIAIVHGAEGRSDKAMEWNQRALRITESSTQPRARQWRASLHNNLGWILHDRGDFAAALTHFELALNCYVESDKPRDIHIAMWCLARCLRSLGRIAEAIALQQALAKQAEAPPTAHDGYVQEEIAECLLALHRGEEAAPFFKKAYELLSKDGHLTHHQPDRLSRLKRMADLGG